MFQYAFGRSLALKHQTELLLDCTILEKKTSRLNFTIRYFELDIFAINAKLAKKNELMNLRPSFLYRFNRRLRRLSGLPFVINPKYLIEQQLSYNNLLTEKGSKDCYIAGFWQSEYYFKSIEPLLRQEFTFRRPLDKINTETANRINSTNSVSLHIRRGDYVKTSKRSPAHTLCPMEYYQKAIEYIGQHIVNPVYFVFSDDPEWAKANLNIIYPSEIVTDNIGNQSYVDMQLMSLCRHNIIANSSFSWWGAWLNSNSDKIVVAPKQWFADESMNAQTNDLIPQAWIRQ